MAKLGDMIKTDDFKNEKHVPVIELPASCVAGEPFNITVSVGKQIAHPNTSEHFIAWITLFYKPEGGKFAYQLGSAEFTAHGATTDGPNSLALNTEPYVTFRVKLEKPGVLVASSYCNIHGLWESEQPLAF